MSTLQINYFLTLTLLSNYIFIDILIYLTRILFLILQVYIEPWHADVFDVLELRKNTGKEEVRARDLFYGLWLPDLFMRRVRDDDDWSLMCPKQCPGTSRLLLVYKLLLVQPTSDTLHASQCHVSVAHGHPSTLLSLHIPQILSLIIA